MVKSSYSYSILFDNIILILFYKAWLKKLLSATFAIFATKYVGVKDQSCAFFFVIYCHAFIMLKKVLI